MNRINKFLTLMRWTGIAFSGAMTIVALVFIVGALVYMISTHFPTISGIIMILMFLALLRYFLKKIK